LLNEQVVGYFEGLEQRRMDQNFGGLSQEQQNDCRAALQKFVDRHAISEWGSGNDYRTVQREIKVIPPPESGLPVWPIQEIAVAGTSFDVAAEVDRMLELAYQTHQPERKTP
jgi:hypothetical protein